MRLWIDDTKDPIEHADSFGLGGPWQWVKSAKHARAFLFHPDPQMRPDVVAFDNDLGMGSDADGRDIAHEILDRVLDDPAYVPPREMHCISYNPVSKSEILATIQDIEHVMKERG